MAARATPRAARASPSLTSSSRPSCQRSLRLPSSRPCRATLELRRWLSAPLVAARRFGSTPGARRLVSNPAPVTMVCPPCHHRHVHPHVHVPAGPSRLDRCASAHHARAFAQVLAVTEPRYRACSSPRARSAGSALPLPPPPSPPPSPPTFTATAAIHRTHPQPPALPSSTLTTLTTLTPPSPPHAHAHPHPPTSTLASTRTPPEPEPEPEPEP